MTKKMNLIIDYFLFLVSWLLIIYGVDVFLYLRGRRHNIIGINARRRQYKFWRPCVPHYKSAD